MSRGCVIPGTPDVAFINLGYASGTIAQVELAWLAPSKLRRTAVVGSERMVVYDDTSGEPVRVFDSGATLPDPESFGEYQLSYRTGDIVSPRVEPASSRSTVRWRTSAGPFASDVEPRSSATIGLEVVTTIEAVDQAIADPGARVGVGSHQWDGAGRVGSPGRRRWRARCRG